MRHSAPVINRNTSANNNIHTAGLNVTSTHFPPRINDIVEIVPVKSVGMSVYLRFADEKCVNGKLTIKPVEKSAFINGLPIINKKYQAKVKAVEGSLYTITMKGMAK